MYGEGLQTSEHLSWKGPEKVLKFVNDKRGGTLVRDLLLRGAEWRGWEGTGGQGRGVLWSP